MKKHILTSLALIATLIASAQVESDWSKKVKDMQESSRKNFEEYRQQVLKDYESFRQEINANYARFMAEAWQHFESDPAEEIPWQPKPPQPVVVNPQTHPTANPIPFNLTPIKPKPIDNPQPIVPIKYAPKPAETIESILYYGTEMKFHINKSCQIKLNGCNESSVSHLWTQLSGPYYDNLIADCLANRELFNLSDWGYIMLSKQVSETICGSDSNEAVALQMYILTQSGFQVRLACANGQHLCILFASKDTIYHHRHFTIDGIRYYCFNSSLENMGFNIFNQAFPEEKIMSLTMTQPKLAFSPSEPRTFSASLFSASIEVSIQTNKNLIDFYNTYPVSCQWNYYSMTSLSDTLKKQLYPALRKAIEGKNQSDAANILINFVQMAFEYATDREQFGYERPLFPDESFFYPYCDCEDRSILYSCLIRELMGLDVVLLHYPRHLATAVHFTENVEGDYLDINGQKYIVCDPTYIGARIGMTMPLVGHEPPKIQFF